MLVAWNTLLGMILCHPDIEALARSLTMDTVHRIALSEGERGNDVMIDDPRPDLYLSGSATPGVVVDLKQVTNSPTRREIMTSTHRKIGLLARISVVRC